MSTGVQEDGRVEVLENIPLLAKEVERNREEGTNEETPHETVVDGTSTEHFLGSKGTPEDGSGKGGVDTRASEMVFLVNRANIGDLRHLIIEDSCADEG